MNIKSLLATLVVSLSLVAPVLAGPFEDGRAALVRGDYAKAMAWFRKAAEQGNAEAQINLGGMYYAGTGVLKDDAKAMAWFRKAAEQGNAEAQINLGAIYLTSKSVPQDYVEAHKWFNLSAAQGVKNAEKYRDLLAKKMTPDQITEAQRLAREWKPKKQEEAEKAKREAEVKQKALRQAAAKKRAAEEAAKRKAEAAKQRAELEVAKQKQLEAEKAKREAEAKQKAIRQAAAKKKAAEEAARLKSEAEQRQRELAELEKKQEEAEKAKREAEAKQKAIRQAAAKKRAAEEAAKRKADLDRLQQELAELEKKQTEDREHLARERDKMAQRLKALEEAAKTRAEVINEKKQKLAALQLPDQQPKPQAAVTPLLDLDAHIMTLVLQHELKRVGCDPGKVDGKWGNQGINALTKFNKYAKLKLPTDTPSMDALEAVKRNKERVCPPVCGPQFNINGDQCVKKTCRAGQWLTSGGQCIKVPVKKPKAPSVAKKKAPPKKTKHEICLEKFGVSACKDISP